MTGLTCFVRLRSALIVGVAALLLASCAGGSSAIPRAAQAKKALASVSFTIGWRAAAASSSFRRPQFVSPSAKSVVIAVNGDPTLTAFANEGSSATSSIALQAPVGSDSFVVSVYDATQSNANAPAGTMLGSVTIVQTIVAGQLNTVSAVVNGYVASVTIDPLPNQPYLEKLRSGYAIVGQHVGTFAVTPRDADGNAIVPPGITPGVTFTTAAGNTYFAVLPPTGTNLNQFSVATTSLAPAGFVGGLVATATDARNVTVTAATTVMQRSEVYVGYKSGQVLAFDDQGNPMPLPAGAFPGLKQPVSLAYDSLDSIVLVADAQSGTIDAYDQNGSLRSQYTPPTLTGVNAITWMSLNYRDDTMAVSPTSGIIAGSSTGAPDPEGGFVSPFDLTAANAAGVAYVTQNTGHFADYMLISDTTKNELISYEPYGNPAPWLQTTPLATPSGTPGALATDPAGFEVFVAGTASGAGELWRYPTVGSTVTPASIADANIPAGIAYDAAIDHVLVAQPTAGNVVGYFGDLSSLDPNVVLTAPAASSATNPEGVTVAY